jgi:outer membrane protein OmpA-like peptidoglycan-associated protein
MRSTGVHFVDGRCTLVVVDHDGLDASVIDSRTVELPAATIVGGRVVDPETLATHLAGIVGVVRGHVVAAWWPDDALLTTIDCTGASRGTVGELVDRVIVDRFGAIRPSVVLREVIVSGRKLVTVGACRSSDLENAHRALLSCGLNRASLILAPAALAIFTRGVEAPAVLAVGSTHVRVLYGFAGWPLVGGSLTSDANEAKVEMFGVGDLSILQHRSLRPPMAHRTSRVFEYSATFESIAGDLRADRARNGTGFHDEMTDPSLHAVPGESLVAYAAALWGATAVADLVPSVSAARPGIAIVADDPAPPSEAAPVEADDDNPPGANTLVEDRPLSRRRSRVLVAAAIITLLLVGGGLSFAASVHDSAEPPVTAAALATKTTTGSSAPAPSVTVPATTAPFVAQAQRALYREGKIYLEGTLPTRADADAFVGKASAMIGRQNVVDNYVIDARASAPSSGLVVTGELLFPLGGDVLQDQDFGLLDVSAIAMKQNEHSRMIVTGYTDSEGDEEANQLLSLRRANAIVNYMAWKGIARSRLEAVGKGESSPIADNATEAGRRQNRRIEVELVGLNEP